MSDVKCAKVEAICAHCRAQYQKRADRVRSPDYCGLDCRKAAHKVAVTKECKQCGVSFLARIGRKGRRLEFCSIQCAGRDRAGERNNMFKGRWIDAKGYVRLNVDGKQHQEHRFIMAVILGRKLRRGEVVHHRNEIKHDNRIENLQVMTIAEHMRIHSTGKARTGLKGEANRSSKLTELKVKEILASNETNAGMARRFGVSEATVWHIRARNTWRHVECPAQ